MKKILTIIIPSYNVGKYLEKGLSSIIIPKVELLQALEVLVVNDGSKDNTSDIGHLFEKQYPGVVRVIDKPNGNYGSCVNIGLKSATGTFVRIQDGDDYFDTDGLQRLIQAISTVEEDVDLVLCDYNKVDIYGNRRTDKGYTYPEGIAFELGSRFYNQRRIDMLMTTYRTDVFRRFAYHQTEGVSYTDGEWITYPMAFVRKVRYFPIVVGLYLLGRDGQTMNLDTYTKNFGQVVNIARDIVRNHHAVVTNPHAVSGSYFTHLCAYMVAMVYSAAILGIDANHRPILDLDAFDRYVRETDADVYAELDTFSLLYRYYHLRIVHAYRRFHSVNDPEILFFKVLSRVYNMAAQLKNVLRREGRP